MRPDPLRTGAVGAGGAHASPWLLDQVARKRAGVVAIESSWPEIRFRPPLTGFTLERVLSRKPAARRTAGQVRTRRGGICRSTRGMETSNRPAAIVTGAGSGVGRACVLKLAREGWAVALVGRRAEALADTIAQAEPAAEAHLYSCPCDIGDVEAVGRVMAEAFDRYGRIDALVNAAGTNIPRRALGELSLEDYHATLATNLHGAFHCVRAVLPVMRGQRAGTIINVNSEAGLRASAKSGAAYVVSKFGLTGLTQTINVEERAHGIRACSIFPGDIDTPLLDKRPEPPPAAARARMMRAEDIAACVWLVLSLPPRAVVEELLVRPL
jgi:NAD(P)-dependent dehydrogenase (short-subunit alcohol dehydrogenase family)